VAIIFKEKPARKKKKGYKMSDSLSFLKRKIDDYIRMYRKESLKSLELSDLYDLFPEKKLCSQK
jgi:hypothetical protein